MKAKLISRRHGEFAFGREATIGRAEGCTVTIDASVVSNEHARIQFDPERSAYLLEDLGSLNGTRLDGIRIERKEVLGKLHVVDFGGSENFIFQLLNVEEGSELDTIEMTPLGKTQVGGEVPVLPDVLREEGSKAGSAGGGGDTGETGAEPGLDPAGGTRVEKGLVPVPEVLAAASDGVVSGAALGAGGAPAFALEFVLEDQSLRFPLEEGANVVGRSETADIRLEFSDLSRRHATVTVAEGKVLVRDEGSRNHTFVDGKQVEEEVSLPSGAQIVFGRLEARVVAMAQAKPGKGKS